MEPPRVRVAFAVMNVVLGVLMVRQVFRTDDPYKAASRAEQVGDVVAGTLRLLHEHRHGGGK